MELVAIADRLRRKVASLSFGEPVTHVYNPLDYAWSVHEAYLRRYGRGTKRAVLVGMNPGPFGMAQTGVPFGDPMFVREWMGLSGEVRRPKGEHPKRPIVGLASTRREVSGSRLWGWAKDTYDSAEDFFEAFFVLNYCPLVFMEASGRNRPPDRLPKDEQEPLFAACDRALADSIETLEPEFVVGVGKFAEDRARAVLPPDGPHVGRILHPSPASPRANQGWATLAMQELAEIGLSVP